MRLYMPWGARWVTAIGKSGFHLGSYGVLHPRASSEGVYAPMPARAPGAGHGELVCAFELHARAGLRDIDGSGSV